MSAGKLPNPGPSPQGDDTTLPPPGWNLPTPKTNEEIKALIEQALALYESKTRSRKDLLESEKLYLQALKGRQLLYGPNTKTVAFVHNRLGLVYCQLNDFAQARKHYEMAEAIYTEPLSLAAVCNNHARLLLREAEAIVEQALVPVQLDSAPAAGEEGFRLFGRSRPIPPAPEVVESVSNIRQKQAADRALLLMQEADQLKGKAYSLARGEAVRRGNDKPAPAPQTEVVCRSPADIVEVLDRLAIGQLAAKRGLAVAAAQHLRRMMLSPEERSLTDKANVMLLGPTGCGKTLLARGLAQAIEVPFYCTEATRMTAAGYIGEDLKSILFGILRAADFDVERAQIGIIYLDEIDKIAAHQMAGQKDIGGRAVQEELLTILEGTTLSVPKDGNRRSTGEFIDIDTTNILFIVGGAFVGLADIVKKRMQSGSSIGFGARLNENDDEDISSCLELARAEDFVKFGMLPEFIGRVPKRLTIETLSVDQLERILVEPDKALVKQKRLLLAETTDLRFTRQALRAIAEEAHEVGTNGRALSEIVEQVLDPIVFEQPKTATITAHMVRSRRAEVSSKNRLEDSRQMTTDLAYIVEEETEESEPVGDGNRLEDHAGRYGWRAW